MQAVSISPELGIINQLVQPSSPLPEALLLKIQAFRDTLLTAMQQSVVLAGLDLNRVRQLTVTSFPAPTDERAQHFAQKMFAVINAGIDKVDALRDFLNSTLPGRLQMEEIKALLNANPAQRDAIIAQFIGPENPLRKQFVTAQGSKPIHDFMLSLDPGAVDQVIGVKSSSKWSALPPFNKKIAYVAGALFVVLASALAIHFYRKAEAKP